MKLTAMLSFYEDDYAILYNVVRRLVTIGVDQIIAVDGAYDLFPGGSKTSGDDPYDAINNANDRLRVPVYVYNGHDWSGNEVEKRNFMLEQALARSEKGDWLLVVDADHLWHSKTDLKRMLATTGCDFAEVSFADGYLPNGEPSWYEARLLMRAVPGMRYDGAHWRVRMPDGGASSTLRAGAQPGDATSLDLRHVASVMHAKYERSAERNERQAEFYRQRDEGGIES